VVPATVVLVLHMPDDRDSPQAWPDEADRPRVTDPAEPRAGHPNQNLLSQVHAHLRAELARIEEALDQLAVVGPDDTESFEGGVSDVRAFLNTMTNRQNRYSLGAFCAAYCRTVATHHAIEGQRMFPDISAAEPALAPVVDRLEVEHVAIAGALAGLDAALLALVAGAADVEQVRGTAGRLALVLSSHLDYEEEQLLGPLGRLPIVV